MMKSLRFLLLGMMVMLCGSAFAEDIIWQEDFSGYANGEVPADGDNSYACVGSGTKIYNEKLAGGESPELLVGKSGGSFSAKIKLNGKSGDMMLTFKCNQNISVLCHELFANRSDYFPGCSNTGNDYSYPFTVPAGTDEITITFKQESSKNARLDNIKVFQGEAKKAAGLSWGKASTTLTMGKEVTLTLSNENQLPVTFSSSNDSVATIDNNGIIKLIKPGNTTFTASFAGNDEYEAQEVSVLATVKAAATDSTNVNPTPSDSTQVIVNPTYIVAGSIEAIFGSYWNGKDSTNTMTQQADSTYIKVYKNVEPINLVQFKVVENGTNWYPFGTADGNGNKMFKVTETCDVTITFKPSTKQVTVAGSGVVELFPSKLQYSAVYVAGDGTNNFPNGEAWNPSAEANKMKSLGNDVWEIQYDGLAQGEYKLKFTIDGKWDVNFGGYFSNFEDVFYLSNDGENIGFKLTDSVTNIVVQLYLGRYDATTKEGAYAIIHKLSPINNAITVDKALELIAALPDRGVSEEKYYVTGKVQKVTEISTRYGNATFTMGNDSIHVLTVYRAKGKDDEMITQEDLLKPGDEVTVFGLLQNYVSSAGIRTPEIAQGGQIITINGKEFKQETGNSTDSTTVTPTPTNNDAITVEKALALIDSLADGAKSEEKYYVTGKVQKVTEISTQYGNATFTMGNDSIHVLTVYRAYGKDNVKITNEELLKPGDEVTVFGLLQNYVRKDSTGNVTVRTPEIAQGGQIITINGKEFKQETVDDELEIITVEQALAIIDTLENAAYTDGEYIVEGYVSKFTEAFNTQYGNYTFLLTTIQNDTIAYHALTVYRAKNAMGNKFTEDVLKVGDKVKVQGRLQKYVKNNVITPEIATGGKILTINGEPTGIYEVKATRPEDNRIFNLSGQRVAIMKKGLYIKNGRKYLAK